MNSTSEDSDDSSVTLDTSTSDEERQNRKRCCIRLFVEETVLSYCNEQFKKHFRLSKEIVYVLIGISYCTTCFIII